MQIRSTLIGNVAVGAALLQLAMIQVYDETFKRLGSSYPFFVIAVIDGVLLVTVLLLGSCGLIETKREDVKAKK